MGIVKIKPALTKQDRERAEAIKARRKAEANNIRKPQRENSLRKKRSVTAIKPTLRTDNKPKLKVASYCRVSTGMEQQETSIENQRRHFEKLIQDNPDWECVGIYWEAAVSATKKETRPELQRLLADCKAGRINLVITKSISRFARNTTDCLEMIRQLKEYGVTVRFEKEGIDTSTMESELLLTLHSSFAEEESHSISKNRAWTAQKQFKSGTFKYSKAPYGYDLVSGNFAINEEQAEIVREIFQMCISGIGCRRIARSLNDRGVPTNSKNKNGEPNEWKEVRIIRMLRNITYTGAVLMQLSYCDEHFKRRKNNGERTQYFMDEHHAPIIDKITFDLANQMIDKRAAEKGIYTTDSNERKRLFGNRYAFTGKLICAECGRVMTRDVEKRYSSIPVIYQTCYDRSGKSKCSMSRVRQINIEYAFINLLNKLSFAGNRIIDEYVKALTKDYASHNSERIMECRIVLEQLREKLRRYELLSSRDSSDMNVYRIKALELSMQITELESEIYLLENDPLTASEIKVLREALALWSDNLCEEFPEDMFLRIVEHVVVKTNDYAEFSLKCGMVFRETINLPKGRQYIEIGTRFIMSDSEDNASLNAVEKAAYIYSQIKIHDS